MKIGLIGLPMTGKTTFFNLLTGTGGAGDSSQSKNEAVAGTARIPDKRIDYLAGIYKPKKVTYAALDIIDIPGITPEGPTVKGSSAYHFLESVRQVDALVHVVRVFGDESVMHIEGTIDPMRDIETINMELLFADLAIIENRIQRIESGKKVTKENLEELEVLKKCRDCLENEKLIHSLELLDEEKQHLKTFNFLTERPVVLLANLDEEQFSTGNYERKEQLIKYAAASRYKRDGHKQACFCNIQSSRAYIISYSRRRRGKGMDHKKRHKRENRRRENSFRHRARVHTCRGCEIYRFRKTGFNAQS